MKRLLLLLIFFSVSTAIHAIDISVVCAGFNSGKGNFFDVDVFVAGRTLKQIQIDSINSVGAVKILVSFSSDTKFSTVDSFSAKSKPTLDPSDIQSAKRFFLPEGLYNIVVTVIDANKTESKAVYKTSAYLDFSERKLRQSDFLLCSNAKVSKAESIALGFNDSVYTPIVYGVVPYSSNKLIVYNEIYNTLKFIKSKINITYAIQSSAAIQKNISAQEFFENPSVKIYKSVLFDLTKIPSGSYRLSCKVTDSVGTVFSERETYFTRENFDEVENAPTTITEKDIEKEFVGPMTDKELTYNLNALKHTFGNDDKAQFQKIINSGTLIEKKLALYSYWLKKSATLPEQAFDEFMYNIKILEKDFGTATQAGFETDRGKIILKYGKPNDIWTVNNEFNALPYEIWIYEKVVILDQKNVRFLFFNPENKKNTYTLLHSTSKDEISEMGWRKKLYPNNNLEVKNHKTETFFKENE